jgi:hypothetical protein
MNELRQSVSDAEIRLGQIWVDAALVRPSQSYLKGGTINHILKLIADDKIDELPPAPMVRLDPDGRYVAIDGHNLLAVYARREEQIKVHLAIDPTDGIPEIDEASKIRNIELFEKFDQCLTEADLSAEDGYPTMAELVSANSNLFI